MFGRLWPGYTLIADGAGPHARNGRSGHKNGPLGSFKNDSFVPRSTPDRHLPNPTDNLIFALDL